MLADADSREPFCNTVVPLELKAEWDEADGRPERSLSGGCSTYPEDDSCGGDGSDDSCGGDGRTSPSLLLWDGICPKTLPLSTGGEGDWEG